MYNIAWVDRNSSLMLKGMQRAMDLLRIHRMIIAASSMWRTRKPAKSTEFEAIIKSSKLFALQSFVPVNSTLNSVSPFCTAKLILNFLLCLTYRHWVSKRTYQARQWSSFLNFLQTKEVLLPQLLLLGQKYLAPKMVNFVPDPHSPAHQEFTINITLADLCSQSLSPAQPC